MEWPQAQPSPTAGAEDKVSSGCSPSPKTPWILRRLAQLDASGSGGSLKSEPVDIDTGNVWSPLPRKVLFPQSRPSSVPLVTQSFQGAMLPLPTYGRKTPESKEVNSTLGLNPFDETVEPIGTTYGPPPSPETSWPYLPRSEWFLIGPYVRLLPIIQRVEQLSEMYMCSGVYLGLANLAELGKRLDWMLTVRTQDPSFGMAISLNSTLSSMNFEEVSTSATCFAGLIDTQFVWRSKELVDLLWPNESGSPPISRPITGTPTLTRRRS